VTIAAIDYHPTLLGSHQTMNKYETAAVAVQAAAYLQ